MGSNLSRFLYPEERLQDQDILNTSFDMDGGVPWTPDPVEEAMDSMPCVTVMGDEHQTERAASPPMDRLNTESTEVNHLGDAVSRRKDILCHQRVVESTNDLSKHVFDVHQLSENRMIETPQHVAEEFSSSKDLKNVNHYYAPCDEAFANFYAQTSLQEDAQNVPENETPLSVNKELSYSVESVSCSEEIDQSLDFENSESLQGPQVVQMIQENSEMFNKSIEIDLEGRQNSQVSVVNDSNMTDDVIFNEASTNCGREMPEIHRQTASSDLEKGSTLEAASIIPHQANLRMELAQTNLDSPEETANVIMDEMLKSIFNNEDDVQRTSAEDEDNTIDNSNNFVNVSQFTVTESIPLKFDLVTGEMVPDINIESHKVGVEQMPTLTQNVAISAPFQRPKEFITKEKAMCSKNVAKVKPNSTSASRSISKVKPLPHNTPLELMTILSASATPSSVSRQCSSRKCSCLKHSVLGYPPSSVLYWQVRTTPGIRKTIMDFDNEGVKFLYDDGCLRAFETVLKSFKPEFLAAEKSLEVSLCLSCVRWAEGEVKERNKSLYSEVANKSHKSTETPSTGATGVDNKSRKRGRPPIPGRSKKDRKDSTDGENVYKKKYSSRSRRTDLAHNQQISEENNEQIEEEKSPKMLMYDLYCDMPGCNARLRGYPSLIKHFKAKHSDEDVTPEETGAMGDNGLCTEDDRKYLAAINDPFLKLKAEKDMKLLYVKVEQLQDLTLPSDICLADKDTDSIHSETIKERRKSVGFKEGESLVTIREISPRRHYETRYRGNEKNEMVAITDLQSPPRKSNVQGLLSPENKQSNIKVPCIKTQTHKEDLKVDKNQNQICKFDMVPETLSQNKTSKYDLQFELQNNVPSKSSSVDNSTSSPMGTSRSASKELTSVSDLQKIENERSPSRLDTVSPMKKLEFLSPELKKLSNFNDEEEQISSQRLIENECKIRSSKFEKNGVKHIEKIRTHLESKSSPGPTSKSQSVIQTRSRKSEITLEYGLDVDSNVLENVDQVSNTPISTESDEVISKRTRSSLSLGEQKSSKKTGLRETGQQNPEPDNSLSYDKVTRTGKSLTNPHTNDVKHAKNDVKDLDKLFADIEVGKLTIQLAAKNEGLKYAKMYHLYRSYKIDKLKSYCEKIKTSNKIKEKYGNRCKMSHSFEEGPAKKSENSSQEITTFNPDNVEHFQEAVNVAEPSEEAVNIGLKNLQDRTNGIRNVKRELKNHLSFAEPLSKDDKKCLLEVIGVINEALLKET